MPLTPWQANTSRVSSSAVLSMRQLAITFETKPAIKPITIAADTSTKPEAGVIATKPQTAPIAIPVAVGFPFIIQSYIIQLRAANAAATFVTTNALTARPLAASAEPALNPNHPNHKRVAPRITNGMLFGGCDSPLSIPFLLPTTIAAARAEKPATMWTTVPPAKSSAPRPLTQPPTPQTQCAIGA